MLKIYGVPNSQPVRAVVWTCLMHELPFEFVMTSQNRDAKHPEFLASVNPRVKIIDGMLAESAFIAGPTATLADISAYEELGQNQAKYANCTDYGPYPAIRRWLLDMERLPFHREAHAVWRLIGDVARLQGGMRTIARANKEAARILEAAVANFTRR